jgi:hypothetical protein
MVLDVSILVFQALWFDLVLSRRMCLVLREVGKERCRLELQRDIEEWHCQ